MAIATLTPAAGCKQEPSMQPLTATEGTQFATSADGTRIAYERLGSGPAIVLVGGLLSDRKGGAPLAQSLADRFTVYTFDRRGRGESGDTSPYSVAKEVEDIAALIKAAGGKVTLYGHSSGAGLALAAAASGQPLDALILHEPPYGASDADSRRQSSEISAKVRRLIAAGQHQDAVKEFLTYAKVPEQAIEQSVADPKVLRMAPSMLHDLDVMDMDGGSLLPEDRVRAVKARTIVLVGGKAPPPFRAAAERIAALIPEGGWRVLDGQGHVADPGVESKTIKEFLRQAD